MINNFFKRRTPATAVEVEKNPAISIGDTIKKVGANYQTEKLYITYSSSLTIPEAQKILGKSIESISSEKNRIVFTLDNGTQVIIEGFTIDHEKNLDSLDIKVNSKILKI